jgi:hypothetical protein
MDEFKAFMILIILILSATLISKILVEIREIKHLLEELINLQKHRE